MHVLNGYNDVPSAFRGAALAIGNFDGVHKGHQAVLAAAKQAAAGAPVGAMTFEPHPRQFFQPEIPLFRLTPAPLKLKLFQALDLDLAVVIPFDAALASLTAEQFVDDILVAALGVSHVITGHDFHFGKGRAGTPEVLKRLGHKNSIEVTVIPPQEGEGGVYSSTAIRQFLREGDVRSAAGQLGYWWRLSGRVTGGDRRGHGLGFPTANVKLAPGVALGHGIYAARVHTPVGSYDGAAYLGTRPSFDDGEPVLETFLFDFEGDLYGSEIEIEFIAYLRDDARFESGDALAVQMRTDCNQAREALQTARGSGLLEASPDIRVGL